MQGDVSQKDQVLVSLYVLGLNTFGQLDYPSPALLQNIQTYLSEYRMMTDAVNIKPAYIINIGCNFDIVIRPNFNGQDVIARCIVAMQNYFNLGNWQINQPIILGDIYSLLDVVEGVQTVKNINIVNKSGEALGYSKYSYDISAGSINGVIYPSLDPSIFEVKYPNTDIQGRVVTN
jgi:phage-related baseplate assembly protein